MRKLSELTVRRRLMTFEQEAQARNNAFGPVSEIGQGAVFDLALLAEGLAQENAGGRIAVGDRFDIHGDKYVINIQMNQGKSIHITWLHIRVKNRLDQVLKPFNGRLPDRSSVREYRRYVEAPNRRFRWRHSS